MKHVEDGVLRAWSDGELDAGARSAVEEHVGECAACRERAERISQRARAFGELFAAAAERPAPDAAAAFTRLQARRREAAQPRRWFSARLWTMAAAGAFALLLIVSAPTRAAARKLLGIFRAKQVVAVPLEHEFVANGKGQLIGDLLSEHVEVLLDEPAREAADRAQASEWAGFAVRLPASRNDAPRILRVEGARQFRLRVDIKRVEAFLDLVHHPDLALPAELAGAQVQGHAPRGVKAVYGECPDTAAALAEPTRLLSCIDLVQSPAATIVTQPELDLRQIAEVGLRVSGMTAEQAAEFNRTIDWTSTAAIPLPRESATYENVRVDGVAGVLVVGRQYRDWPTRWSLIWVRDERVYNLGGFGEPRTSLAIAESLR